MVDCEMVDCEMNFNPSSVSSTSSKGKRPSLTPLMISPRAGWGGGCEMENLSWVDLNWDHILPGKEAWGEVVKMKFKFFMFLEQSICHDLVSEVWVVDMLFTYKKEFNIPYRGIFIKPKWRNTRSFVSIFSSSNSENDLFMIKMELSQLKTKFRTNVMEIFKVQLS